MKEILTINEIARYLRVKPLTIYKLVAKNKIPHFRVGRKIRFITDEILKWMRGEK